MNRELMKFFAGFFFASIMLHIIVIFLGILPLTIRGMVFDYSFWTATLTLSCVLAIFCSYLGWERKSASKISLSVLIFVLFIVLVSGSFFYNSNDFVFTNNKLLMASIGDIKVSQNNNIQEIKNTNFDDLNYSFVLGSQGDDFGKSITTDKNNNFYVAGSFHGTINLDRKGKFEKTSLGGIGNDTDIYVAKYNQYGDFIWGFSLGSIGYDSPETIKLDGDGSVYLAGYFGGRADFDPSEKEFILDAGIGRDGFVAKYDSDGRFLWAQKIGNQESIPFEDNDIRFEQVTALGFDQSNNVYAAGYFDGEINFTDADGNEITLTATKNSKNIFLLKYNKDGNIIKAVSLAGGTVGEPKAMLIDANGSIYLSGNFNTKIAFDSSNPKKFSYVNGGQDIFLLKYDTDLNYLWSKKWGSMENDDIGSMVFSHDGDIVLVGYFGSSINFQGVRLKSSGMQDVFVLKVNNLGETVFAKGVGGTGKDGGLSVTVDSLDNIYMVGYFSGLVNFDPKRADSAGSIQSLSSGDATDAFIAKYNAKGEFVWARSLGGDVSLVDEFQNYSGVAIDSLDYPIVVGTFAGNYAMDNVNLTSVGGMDSVVVKYDPEGK